MFDPASVVCFAQYLRDCKSCSAGRDSEADVEFSAAAKTDTVATLAVGMDMYNCVLEAGGRVLLRQVQPRHLRVPELVDEAEIRNVVPGSLKPSPQSEDFARMFEWFDEEGYSFDLEMLREEFPEVGWTNFKAWVEAQDWSGLRQKRDRTAA